MEWIKALFDIGKLPSKILLWVALLSGILLFGPLWLLTKLHLETVPANFGFYIGTAFVGSSSLLSINFSLWLFHTVRSFILRRLAKIRLTESLSQLDPAEKAVLREFYICQQNSLRMPIDNPTVAGLYTKGIVGRVGQLGENSIAGVLFTLAIAPEVKRLLSYEILALPLGEPTKEDLQRIRDSRPSFVRQIEQLDSFRNILF
jgi:Super-infection exclusion protein B